MDESLHRFERLDLAFSDACDKVGGSRSFYRFAGYGLRLQVAGDRLAANIDAPLSHLRQAQPVEAQLTVDLWDLAATGVTTALGESPHAVGEIWKAGVSSIVISPDARFVSYEEHGSIAWLDRHEQRIIGWFADANRLSLQQRGRPLQFLFTVWANDRGLQPIHAALAARDGRGVLLSGSSGSGKSTTALCCLQAGMTFISDDWVSSEIGGQGNHRGYGLYGSVFLNRAHAGRFPLFRRQVLSSGSEDPKSLVLLPALVPELVGGSASVCAVVLPRVADGAHSVLRAATKKEALLSLIRSTLFEFLPHGGHAAFERLARLIDDVPTYWLDLGRDLDAVAQPIDEVLARNAQFS